MKYKVHAKYTYYDDDDLPHEEPHDLEVEAENPQQAFDIAVDKITKKYSGFINGLNFLEIISLNEAESGKSFKISEDRHTVIADEH